MERIDYDFQCKYFSNHSLALGRLRQQGPQPAKKEKQEFSLVALNPHRNIVGLAEQDFTVSKLCGNLVTELEAADTPAAAAAAAQQDSDAHQLLDARTPAAPAPDADATAAADAVADDAIPTIDLAHDEQDERDGKVPEIQFVLSSDGDSGSESDSEGDSDSESEPELQDSEAAAAAAAVEAQEHSRPAKKPRRDATAAADDSAVLIGSSSSSGSESDDERDDEQQQQQLLSELEEDAAESEDDADFIPLLPVLNAAKAQGSTAAAAAAAAVPGSSSGREPGFKPPWLPRLARFGSPLLRLHNEVVAFTKMLEPTAEEVESRSRSMKTVREVVHSIWPQAKVLVFGSYETGLYTPASDTDIVVCDTGLNNPTTGLKALAQALTQRQLVRNLQQVLTARVPIIKFEMVDSGLAFDVAWEQRSGPQGAAVVKQLLAAWPVMKPLVLVLKVFLTQRELNEVYQGGIGSYSLIIMVAAFLQMHASRRPGGSTGNSSGAAAASGRNSRKRARSVGGNELASALDANLGLLLVDFLRLYGRALNFNQVGVSCSSDGYFYDKSAKGFYNPDRPFLLSVEDPLDPANDKARSSYNFKTVRQVFDHGYQLLTAPCTPGESLLGRIIHLAPVVAGRPVPTWFHESSSSARGGRDADRSRSNHSSKSERRCSAGDGGSGARDRDRRQSQDSRRRSSSRSEQQQQQQRTPYSGSKGGRSQQQQQQQRHQSSDRRQSHGAGDSYSRGGSSSSGKKRPGGGNSSGRDAAGRAGAAAGGGSSKYHQQQQQQQYQRHGHQSRSPGPGRKKQRR